MGSAIVGGSAVRPLYRGAETSFSRLADLLLRANFVARP